MFSSSTLNRTSGDDAGKTAAAAHCARTDACGNAEHSSQT
jgi:hypothetical protein